MEEKLEIVIITHNRARFLDETLRQLAAGPFAACRVTVLDNCSTDETPSVCASFTKIFPRYRIVRHHKNIGGVANILRAVEVSEGTYTWILGDDDTYDFSECEDVIQALKEESFNMISVGSPGQYEWERGLRITAQELFKKGARFYCVFTFISGFIFRTADFDSECLELGYFIAGNLYPHFVYVNKAMENNYSICVSKRRIVHRGVENRPPFSALFWLASWVQSCRIIKDRVVRRRTIYEAFPRGRFVTNLIRCIVSDKLHKGVDNKIQLSRTPFLDGLIIFNGLSFDQRLLFLMALPFALVPAGVYRFLKRLYSISFQRGGAV